MTKGIFFSHLFLRGYSLFPHVKKIILHAMLFKSHETLLNWCQKKKLQGKIYHRFSQSAIQIQLAQKKNVFPYYQPLNRLRTF